jgi:hypothetical protein
MRHLESTMSRMKEHDDDGARPSGGNTVTAQGDAPSPKPRLPHERDESADNQATDNPAARRIGEIAHDGVVKGQQDTSKAQETDAAYRQLRESAAPAPRAGRKGDGGAR